MTAAEVVARGEHYRWLARRVRDPAVTEILVADQDTVGFWTWWADAVRGPGAVRINQGGPPVRPFPPATGAVGVWVRDASTVEPMETAYTVHQVEHLRPTVLREDRHAGAGELTDLDRAACSAAEGLSVSYIGRSLDVLAPAWHRDLLAVWNEYHPEHRMHSGCAGLSREQVLCRVLDAGIAFSECLTGTEPCADCFGCFELYYTAAAVGRPVEYRLTTRIFDEVAAHLAAYAGSGFRRNHRDALQRLVRLQMLYGLTFDRMVDCR